MSRKPPAEVAPVEDDRQLLSPTKEQMKAKEMFQRVMIVAELLSQSQEPTYRLASNAPGKTQK